MARVLPLLLIWALTVPTPAAAEPSDGKIPFSNTILVYSDPGRDWNLGSFKYYLAYGIEEGGVRVWPLDQLFDGFLFLSIKAPSGRNFWDGQADASDWDWWLERLFEPGRQLDALEKDVQAAGRKLGPAAPRRVIISIPRPPVAADAAGQEKVVKDFVDRCVRRFGDKGYRRIALDGFYWFHEGVDGTNADIVNSLHKDLGRRGLRLYWIPYDVGHENRAHLEKWKAGDIKFDGVWLQPNYFWADRNAKYAAQDLDDTVTTARTMGSFVEIEFDHGVYTTGWKLGRYLHYLMSADVYGYGNGPLMYYDGYMGYIKCGQSRNPVQRALYDDLYSFTRKAYLPKPITYPGVFFEAGSAADPAVRPEIGLWLEKGGATGGRIYLVEPDPNKDYLVILEATGGEDGTLEALVDNVWVALESMRVAGARTDESRLERYKLPRALIQKVWESKTQLVIELRRVGGGTVEEAWARPDDFVFRHLKGKHMKTEMYLDVDRSPDETEAATLANAFGETVVGLRLAGRNVKKAALEISGGQSPTKQVARGTTVGGDIIWTIANGDRWGDIKIRFHPGLDILELWAFPADAVFHLRPGSGGDTCADLHVPGVSLVPDGGWRLAGEFGRNHRSGGAGASLRVSAPPVAKSWELTLLVDSPAECTVEAVQGGAVKASAKIAARSSQRVSMSLRPGEYVVRFAGPVALHDVWLTPR